MKIIIFKTFVLLLIFTGCKKDKEYIEGFYDLNCLPNYGLEIDADEDGITDFNIYCSKALPGSVIGPGDGHIFGSINPSENVSILLKNQVGVLFLVPNDIINSELNDSTLFWSDVSWFLVDKIWYEDTGWNEYWSVLSIEDEYYMGFKLHGTTEKIGWMKFQFNTTSGEVSVTDKVVTTSNSLSID